MVNKTKEVRIVPYDPAWKTAFESIRAELDRHIGDLVLAIEHVGSTSVEGLGAKPVIDIDVVMDSYEVFPAIVERLGKAGFRHEGNLGVEGREAFKRTYEDGFMAYHLYVCPKDGRGYLEHIAFRDYLRAHPAARKRYQRLKEDLAAEFRYDRDTYCEKKTGFVRDILNKTLYKE
ncbi:GrpB family protein [Paenibacillus chitinolyticus]|uniref:GrpB family protein n=1 Tax=Paenibacillus chitinolyticus TaxID=79263 RepID=UPI003AF053CA